MNNGIPQITRLGERHILITFEPEISVILLNKLIFLKDLILKTYNKEILEITNTYDSLLISYALGIDSFYSVKIGLLKLISTTNITKLSSTKIYHIPVYYDLEFGLDLEYVAKKKSCSINEIIQLHTAPVYTIYFIGFLPGFLYLGGLDERLFCERKNEPRLDVKKGAVGIGGNQTGIYPKNSPGGWQILGNSPITFFDKNKVPPTPFSPGDQIKFYDVSLEEYLDIEREVKTGNYQLKMEVKNG